MAYTRLLGERYTPLYFFNALISGELALSFYLYIYWYYKTAQSTMPTFKQLALSFHSHQWSTILLVGFFLVGFLFFLHQHIRLVFWNFKNFQAWKHTSPYKSLMATKDKTILLILPATLSVSLILVLCTGLMALPDTEQIEPFFFPLLLVALFPVAWKSLRLYTDFLSSRLLEKAAAGPFGSALGQWIIVFSFALMALPFALIAQNSSVFFVTVAASLGAISLFLLAILVACIRFLPRLRAVTQEPLAPELAPLFWFSSGILALLSLVYVQLDGGLSNAFNLGQRADGLLFILFALFVLCFFLGFIGKILWEQKAPLRLMFEGKFYSLGLYGLLFPALIGGILYSYLINVCCVMFGPIQALSISHFLAHVPLLLLHLWCVRFFYRLNSKLFSSGIKKPIASA
ncbi:MAG: hypothetical protein AB7E52_08290 [Bdellovibrionales bacterium]